MQSRSGAAIACTSRHLFVCIALVCIVCLFLGPGTTAADEQPPVLVENLSGQRINPFASTGTKAIVFVFLSVDCPICNQYAPELMRLKNDFATNGLVIKLVYPNADEDAAAVRQHARDYNLDLEQLRDPQHALVNLAGVKVTPEAAVFVSNRRLVYCGRIDNRYKKVGVARLEATEHNLREVLNVIRQNKQPKLQRIPAVGCSISPVK
jgi:peroxiredoxin